MSARTVFGRIAAAAAARPRATLALGLAGAIAAAVYAAATFKVNADTTDMLSADLPFRQALSDLRDAFPTARRSILAVVTAPTAAGADHAATALTAALAAAPGRFASLYDPAADPYLKRNAFYLRPEARMLALTDRLLRAAPGLTALAGDPTPRRLFRLLALAEDDAFAADGGAGYDRLLFALAGALEADARGVPGRIDWAGLFLGDADGARPARRILFVEPSLDFGGVRPGGAAVRAVRAAWDGLEIGAARLALTGPVALRADETRAVLGDIRVSAALSAAIVAAVLVLGLGGFRLAVIAVSLLGVGLLYAGGWAMASVGAFNLLSIAFVVLMIGLGVDFFIHFILRAREEAGRARARAAALVAAADALGKPLALCCATGVLAFLAFTPTDYDGLAELGVIAAGGLAIAFALTFTLLPAALALTGVKPIAARRTPAPQLPPRAVLAVAGALFLGGLALAPGLRFDFDPMSLRDPASESVVALRALERDGLGSQDRLEIVAPDAATAAAIVERVRASPAVGAVRSLADFEADPTEEQRFAIEDLAAVFGPALAGAPAPALDDDETASALRALRRALDGDRGRGGAAARAALSAAIDRLDPTAMDGLADRLHRRLTADLIPFFADLNAALAPDARPRLAPDAPLRRRHQAADGRVRIEVRPATPLEEPGATEAFVAAVDDAVEGPISGRPAINVAAGDAVTGAFAQAIATALAAVALLLLIALRRGGDALFALAPLALATAVAGGATVLADMPFNYANVIVLPLLFGLGVDNGIHAVSRWREGEAAAVRSTTGRAIVVSSLTTIGSFASLTISSHQGVASLGALLTIAVCAITLATLVALPAALRLRPPPNQDS